ncbi:hypothetical protein [Fodinicurvata sp. EGI_FJ10296]|uniref:hypothetical protein n=1 Tax=Fodinicurvata sp. EGI_FJ10296 TaxID=3231908 RepID=UPI003454890C
MSADKNAILKQIAEIRSRLDPSTLHRVEAIVQPLVEQGALGPGGSGTGTKSSSTVAYDRETAVSAVKVFLDSRADGGNFKRRLRQALKRETH